MELLNRLEAKEHFTERECQIADYILRNSEAVQTEAADETAETQAGTEESALSALQAQYDELNDRYLRMAAEYDNFRKRSRAERDSVHAEAVAYAVKALLATVDNLSRALAQPTEDAAYKQGIEMTYNQMMESFQSLGVTEIVSEPGTVFDPNLHNAVMHIDDDSFGENVIAEVFQKGFQLGDKVIRHAMVKVAN